MDVKLSVELTGSRKEIMDAMEMLQQLGDNPALVDVNAAITADNQSGPGIAMQQMAGTRGGAVMSCTPQAALNGLSADQVRTARFSAQDSNASNTPAQAAQAPVPGFPPQTTTPAQAAQAPVPGFPPQTTTPAQAAQAPVPGFPPQTTTPAQAAQAPVPMVEKPDGSQCRATGPVDPKGPVGPETGLPLANTEGVPWNSAFHSSNQKMTAKGAWFKRRGGPALAAAPASATPEEEASFELQEAVRSALSDGRIDAAQADRLVEMLNGGTAPSVVQSSLDGLLLMAGG